MDKKKKEYLSIDEYILSFPENIQKKLEEMRNLIKEQVLEAEEKISYQIPAFFLKGNPVYFAGYSKHIGFFTREQMALMCLNTNYQNINMQ